MEKQTAREAIKFLVYIIESPSAPDLYHGRSEGSRVAETLRLDGIPCVTRTAINREAFVAALRLGLPEAMKEIPERHPILHLSAHGSNDGIHLSSGEMLCWADLRDLLIPVNQSLSGGLILCMSACKGYSGCRMAMELGDVPDPYYVMIGSGEDPTWSDTAVSYLTFYHLISKGRTIPESVLAMSTASGVTWICDTAQNHKQTYLDYVTREIDPAEAQRQLESVAEREPMSPNAKSLESGIISGVRK